MIECGVSQNKKGCRLVRSVVGVVETVALPRCILEGPHKGVDVEALVSQVYAGGRGKESSGSSSSIPRYFPGGPIPGSNRQNFVDSGRPRGRLA